MANPKIVIDMLADHKMFKLMLGNPATIIVIASIYKNKKRQI